MPWGLWPQNRSAAGEFGPTESRGKGKGWVGLPKFFPDWWTKTKVNRILMLMNSAVSCTIAQCFVHLSSVTRSRALEAPMCTGSLFGHSLTHASKDCTLSADLRLLPWGLSWRSTHIAQSEMPGESQRVTRTGCAPTWWSGKHGGSAWVLFPFAFDCVHQHVSKMAAQRGVSWHWRASLDFQDGFFSPSEKLPPFEMPSGTLGVWL